MTFALWFREPPADDNQRTRAADFQLHEAKVAPVENEPDDRELIAGIRAGHAAAFETLLTRCIPLATTAAYRILGDIDAARDVASEVLVKLWDQRATFAPASSVAAYIVAASRHRALNLMRDIRRRSAMMAEQGIHTPYPGMSVPPVTPDVTAERAELSVTLARALAALSPRAREIASLRWQSGLSRAEIAAALGITISTVSNTLVTAARTVRLALDEGEVQPD